MKTISLFLFSMVLACSQSKSGDYAYTQFEEAELAVEDSYSGTTYDGTQSTTNLQVVEEAKIIKTANLRFPANNIDKTHASIKSLVSKHNGIIQEDRSGKGYNELYRDMVIRIPSQHFQTVIDSISAGVDYFDQNNISQQDVSEEFVDLQARLKAKRQLENRYLELLKQAKNVTEILEIERELSVIREEIEAREGRLKFLENRVSYSTINVYFYKTTTDAGVTKSYGSKMGHAIKSGWNGLSVFFLGLLHIWPFFVILFILIFVLKRYLSRRKKNRS
ncbi:MAG TPA: DUF4349 domain-containing protein [Flavobacteriaceae bacterium]|nr:DUF4349 domain-containing protein [Flavobacteriaceae bacterium]